MATNDPRNAPNVRRVLIAAGGTGGHVYPALAAAEAILEHEPATEIGFVGGRESFERDLLAEAGVPFAYLEVVRAGPLHGVPPLQVIRSLIQLARGLLEAVRLLRRRRPQVILLTGGWVGLPVALAARLRRVPSLIYLPDIEPGLTIKMLAPLVSRVAATVDESKRYFPRAAKAGRFLATGYPIRRQMREQATGSAEHGAEHRAEHSAQFDLLPDRPVLLVFGGSRGARSINNAVLELLPDLMRDGVQVIHVTGTLDWEQITARRTALAAQLGEDAMRGYHPFAYLHHEMGAAMAAADLVVCRSGASVLGELPLFGLPSILVPYPYAWRYQKVNADWLAERGAAMVLPDDAMETGLLPTIRELFVDRARLQTMAERARALRQPDGAWNVGRALLQLIKTG